MSQEPADVKPKLNLQIQYEGNRVFKPYSNSKLLLIDSCRTEVTVKVKADMQFKKIFKAAAVRQYNYYSLLSAPDASILRSSSIRKKVKAFLSRSKAPLHTQKLTNIRNVEVYLWWKPNTRRWQSGWCAYQSIFMFSDVQFRPTARYGRWRSHRCFSRTGMCSNRWLENTWKIEFLFQNLARGMQMYNASFRDQMISIPLFSSFTVSLYQNVCLTML